MHPGNASRSPRRSPSNLPSLHGLCGTVRNPISDFVGAQNVAASDGNVCFAPSVRRCGTLAAYPIFTRTSVSECPLPRIQALSRVDAGRCALGGMAVPAMNACAESHGPVQGPTCASRHKKAHWHRRCDQSHSQMGIVGPLYLCETPNNKWVGPLFRRSVGGRCDATNSGPFLICGDRGPVCCRSGGLIFR